MVEGTFQSPITSFRSNRDSVYELLEFERTVLDLALVQLETVKAQSQRTWAKVSSVDLENYRVPPHLDLQKTITMLKGIRDHESLRPRYEVMVNQCVVLLVSYFGSAVKDLFREGVSRALQGGTHKKVLSYEVKVRAEDLRAMDKPHEFVVEQIASSSDISFQDMNSIRRAFLDHFGFEMSKDEVVNDIILAHACRHAIVHHGMEIDQRLVKQVSGASPRRLKRNVKVGERLQFSPDEVRDAGKAMTTYLERAAAQMEESFQNA